MSIGFLNGVEEFGVYICMNGACIFIQQSISGEPENRV
jgi:hypothetical protein